jgi:thiamine biosynthesis lipoprotein
MAVTFFLMPIGRVVVGWVMLLVCAGRPLRSQQARFEFAQVHMGMEVRLVLYAGDSALARSAATAAFDRIRKLEDTMSDYRDESEVRRLVRRPGEWVPVSADLFAVLADALTLARLSEGAFDPTVGPLVSLWRTARRTGRLPLADSLSAAQGRVGWRLVELDSLRQAVRLARPGMLIDLGGIAKGYILDQALRVLRETGLPRALLVAGGDILAGEAPPGRAGWQIEIVGAGEAFRRQAESLANGALSTSSDGEQFVVIDGVRYSHVVDPRTGMALTNSRRAYVIAGSGAMADGLATAFTVTDSAGVRRLLSAYPGVLADVATVRPDSSSTPGPRPSRSAPSSGRSQPK